MTCKASISHDQAMVKELRENPAFPAEYLRVAAEVAQSDCGRRTAIQRKRVGMPQPKLTLYTRPDCPPCDWLKTWLRERGLAFEEHDVSTDKVAVFQLVRT